jgi:hypothetical protein
MKSGCIQAWASHGQRDENAARMFLFLPSPPRNASLVPSAPCASVLLTPSPRRHHCYGPCSRSGEEASEGARGPRSENGSSWSENEIPPEGYSYSAIVTLTTDAELQRGQRVTV